MKFKIKFVRSAFALAILAMCSTLYPQQQQGIEEMVKELEVATEDTARIDLWLNIGYGLVQSMPDSAMVYFTEALELSEEIGDRERLAKSLRFSGIIYYYKSDFEKTSEYYRRSIEIYEELDLKSELAVSYSNLGMVYYYKGSYDTAAIYYQRSLNLRDTVTEKPGIASCYNSLGLVYEGKGMYDKAIEYYLLSIKIYEEIGHEVGIATAYHNIGMLHKEQGNFQRSIEYYGKALDTFTELGQKYPMATCNLNLGNVYNSKEEYDTAMVYYRESLGLFREVGNKQGISRCYNSMGIVMTSTGDFSQAIEYYKNTLAIAEEIEDLSTIVGVNNNIATLHISIADSLSARGQNPNADLRQAVRYAEKSITIAREMGSVPIENEAAATLKDAHAKLGNYQKALEYAGVYISTSDSMFNEQKTRALQEMETRYETEKKQQQIEMQEVQIANQDLEIRQQKTLRNALLGGLALFAVIVALVIFAYYQKRRDNRTIIKQKEDLQAAHEVLKTYNEEIEAQRDLVTDQKNKIEQIHADLSQSIDYAQRIQASILPDPAVLKGKVGEYFVVFKPRDVVSGDFYWWAHIENTTIIAAADCTGHGVPGAFMSMLGVTFLREIVTKEYISKPEVILRRLRKEVVRSLKQKGEVGEQSDGMDLSLITIDQETGLVQYAGAYNPLYIISEEPVEIASDELRHREFMDEKSGKILTEIKADKMPIGIYRKMDNFTCHDVKVRKGDTLYMFSDGFADQFGGEKGKKYMFKPFKQLLLENSAKTMKAQKEILERTFEEWSEGYEQNDDVVLIGVKI